MHIFLETSYIYRKFSFNVIVLCVICLVGLHIGEYVEIIILFSSQYLRLKCMRLEILQT